MPNFFGAAVVLPLICGYGLVPETRGKSLDRVCRKSSANFATY